MYSKASIQLSKMKKLLLIFLITFGVTGLANAEYSYQCETTEYSFFYHPSTQEPIAIKPTELNFGIIYSDYQNWDSNHLELLFHRSPFNNTDNDTFIINDYEDYQNFNATLQDETNIFSNLSYENGSLILTWMNRDSASMGAYFANCIEDYLIIDYSPILEDITPIKIPITQVCLDELEQEFNNRLLELEIERSELQACAEGDSSATRLACKFSLLLVDTTDKIRYEYNNKFKDCLELDDNVD